MIRDAAVLIAAWQEGRDEAAARELVEALYPQVIRIVRNHLPRGLDEQDLAQEIFQRLFAQLHRYDPKLPLENWLSRLALNVCRNAFRGRSRRPELRWADLSETEQTTLEAAMLAPETATAEQARDARELLDRALSTLGPDDRVVITLLHLEERDVSQIAALTGWSATGVRVRAFRARWRLKKALAELAARFPGSGSAEKNCHGV
jgi:RNA polymerase sigma-70 factor (ECF subfamily)